MCLRRKARSFTTFIKYALIFYYYRKHIFAQAPYLPCIIDIIKIGFTVLALMPNLKGFPLLYIHFSTLRS